jgi:hypothetical protein
MISIILPGTNGMTLADSTMESKTHNRRRLMLALLSLLSFSMAACSGSFGSGSIGSGSPELGSSGSSGSGSGARRSSVVALSTLTGNNTASCPANAPLPVHCLQTFTGQTDTRPDVLTPEFDPPAGNVSDEDPHSYFAYGSNTKIFANMMLGYCTAAGSAYCDNNVETGYASDDPNTIAAQATDMKSRHLDGAIMSWEGPGTSEDAATLLFQWYVNQNYCGAQGCSLMYVIMDDGPSWSYTVASTGIPGTTGESCSGQTGANFENCVIAHLRNDMCYMNGMHWGNSAYLKSNGQPIVQIFPDETVIPPTGPAPSWADVWVHIGDWNQNLPENCAMDPYNTDNGVPLILFENTGGLTHEDSSGAYYWIEPAQATDPAADQLTLNISPATIGGTLDNFLATALEYPDLLAWSNAFKGFNSSQSTWGTGRTMDQECGQTWVTSLTESNLFYASAGVPYLQISTWNDYNEGTEIESGIDNCYTVSAKTSGKILSWALNTTNSGYASLTTVSHMEIYDSPDGQSLTLVATLPASAEGSWKLSRLPSGRHTLFVRMVGKNSVRNQMSPGVPYLN